MNRLLVLLVVIFSICETFGFETEEGVSRSSSEFSDEFSEDLMRAGAVGMDAYIKNYAPVNETVVLLDNILFRFDESLNVKGNWLLTSYDSHLFLNSEKIATSDKLPDTLAEQSQRLANPVLPVENYDPGYVYNNPYERAGVGCLADTPLRYGDVDSDGAPELVLMLGKNVVLFSPELGKTVFSFHYWMDDEWTDTDQLNDWLAQYQFDNSYQFVAGSSSDVLVNEPFPAWRSVTKVFDGEFDGQAGYDLLLWRKVFDTNLIDQEPGFHRVADVKVHYAKKDGLYIQQDTDQATIESWLSKNELTWSKGYPSISECEGEEVELIPEMHDVLLNDPDVLQ